MTLHTKEPLHETWDDEQLLSHVLYKAANNMRGYDYWLVRRLEAYARPLIDHNQAGCIEPVILTPTEAEALVAAARINLALEERIRKEVFSVQGQESELIQEVGPPWRKWSLRMDNVWHTVVATLVTVSQESGILIVHGLRDEYATLGTGQWQTLLQPGVMP